MLIALALMPFEHGGCADCGIGSNAGKRPGHCDEHQKPVDAPSAPKAHCATCAALPATDTSAAIAELRPGPLLQVQGRSLDHRTRAGNRHAPSEAELKPELQISTLRFRRFFMKSIFGALALLVAVPACCPDRSCPRSKGGLL